MDLCHLTAHELHDMLINRKTSAFEITKSVFQQIDKIESTIHSYVTLTRENAFETAEKVDKKIASGENISPLTGIPMAIKDVMCTKGILTSCGSKILSNFIAPYDATAVKKLKDQDVVIIGKANMDEFAMGSSTETSYFGITRNPWDTNTVPGGSSGGSATSVSSGEAICSLGSDTGGSIRQPASLCGVVGLKPTYGRVSRYGLVAFASSLDQIGPFAKDVTDCALILNTISGRDEMDSTSVDLPVPDYTKSLVNDVKGLKIGIPKEYFIEDGMDPEVTKSVQDAIKLLEKLGAVCIEVSLPHTDYGIADYQIISRAEASANLARFDGTRYGYRTSDSDSLMDMYKKTRSEGFGSEVKLRIMLGTYALSSGYYDAYYLKALKVRTLIKGDFDKAFEKCDVLLTPTSPTPAFKFGEKMDDPLTMYLSDVFTVNCNLAGIPGISLPCGFSSSVLPIGLQILGKPFDEETIFRVAYTFEQNTDYHLKRPKL
ncbi:MAG: aspartyl-tRNA(Asn)/glutamyl-tRNA(Gln) amidotransferase subunit [Candidatus Poribacteria bacterium]|nr:aspartyl-tRNA(Asn)/glutamyl-tRNA(Gln) amidotransferase subunit [Candidatus Poribacteria bacterium]